jgi:hypothetical protein
MSTTNLYWKREKPLADFSDGKGNLIFVTSSKGVEHVIDDIFDDQRNDELNLLVIKGDETSGEISMSSLEKSGIEHKESHRYLGVALASVLNETKDKTGSVVIIDTSSISVDYLSRSAILNMMKDGLNRVMLIVTVEGIETMQHYLSLDPRIVIDLDNSVQKISL